MKQNKEIHHRLSMEWEQVPLSSLYYVKYGKANPGFPGNVPVIGSSGVYARTEKPLILHPTIVIGRKGSAGQAWLVEEPSHPSDTTFYLEPRSLEKVDITFTYFSLRYLQISASNDVIPSLQRHELENLTLPFPPLPEQRAIAAVLSKIQAAVEVQDKIVATLKELKAAIMAKLFHEGLRGESLKQTEIGEIPESWELGDIDDVKSDEKGAVVSGPFGSNIGSRFFVASGIPVIRGNNLTKGEDFFVDGGFVFVTEEKAQELSSCTAVPGDLIFTAAGTIGQVGLILSGCNYSKYIISNKQLRARIDKKKADPLFLFYWFSSRLIQQLFEQRRGGTSIPVINLKVLRSIPVPLMSLDEQIEMARICHTVHFQLQLAVRRRVTLKSIFSSMLHLLMTGQVRVNLKVDATKG